MPTKPFLRIFFLEIGGHLPDLEKPTDELQADWARVVGVIGTKQSYDGQRTAKALISKQLLVFVSSIRE
jgi:hypothetical protein